MSPQKITTGQSPSGKSCERPVTLPPQWRKATGKEDAPEEIPMCRDVVGYTQPGTRWTTEIQKMIDLGSGISRPKPNVTFDQKR